MAGLNFLEKLMRAHPMPVLMTSSLTDRGCETTLRALELGAVDFVSKLAEAQARLKRRSGRSEGPAEAQARLKRRLG
jgi:chemotaxis response regulator CheB